MSFFSINKKICYNIFYERNVYMKIGLFDSGMGGLNVLVELLKVYPNNEYIYYGDTKNLPYGDKNKEELLKLASPIIHFFEEQKVDLIIVACGTISSNCFEELKQMTKIPLYDIINPTINYINNSEYQNIGLIGTNKTIESGIFTKKILNRSVYSVKTPELVPIIENNLEKEPTLTNYLLEFKDNVDCLILGCTHYPLLKTEINNYLNIPLIDMGKCLSESIKLTNNGIQKITLYFSLLNEVILQNINNIITWDKEIVLINNK